MADPARARRLAKRMMAMVATELQHQVKDPRLAMVTITDTTLTADLRDATVYYTVFGDDKDRRDTAVALQSATGMIRSAVGAALGIKFTPTITFVRDQVGEHSRHIEELLAAARESDSAIAARSVGARYAGEADPYRETEPADAASTEAPPLHHTEITGGNSGTGDART